MPELAVVLATYNRNIHLQQAIGSVRRAVGELPYEIIVVDGGSTDGSREWLAVQTDVVIIGQRGPLTGAVRAFNLGFGYAVDAGFDYVCHFNDDAEFVTERAVASAVDLLERDPAVGEVAFEFDLFGPWGYDYVHHLLYANFGVVRRKAGMAVAQAQGDLQGRSWWNPLYRTYGADSEFGCWIWKLGWKVLGAHGLRVHDKNVRDDLRAQNENSQQRDGEGELFWQRWPTRGHLEPFQGIDQLSWKGARLHLGCGRHRLAGWINADAEPTPAVDVLLDLHSHDLDRIPTGVIDWIYWSHGPEHIYPDKLHELFSALRRILRPGGKLTVATIDLEGIWSNRFQTPRNGAAWNAALYGETNSTDKIHYSAHKLCFTQDTLRQLFQDAGFKDIRRWQPEEYPQILALNDYAVSCRLVTMHLEGHA